MIVEIDVDFLIQHKITANHYLILQLLHQKKSAYLKKYVECSPLTEEDLRILSEKKLIHNVNDEGSIDLNKIIIRSTFSSLLSEGDFFDELYDLYPHKIHRVDGRLDYLRSNIEKSRELYSNITKNKKAMHDKIIRCLEFEKLIREREGSMKWFKKLYKWLESEEWKNWEERMIENPFIKNENALGYGNELI